MKKCILCGQMTNGSVGAAGLKWSFICQPCKNQEDQAALDNLKRMGTIADKFFEVLLDSPRKLKAN